MEAIKGRIGLILVAIIWGSGFAASALALESFNTNQILAMRFTIAFLISLLVYKKDLKLINFDVLKKGIIIGIFLFLAFMFQTIGLKYTTASKNAFLTAVNIVIVPFLSFLILRKKVKKQEFLGALITLFGIALLSFDSSGIGGINKGDVLTLVCAIFFALQIFYTDFHVKDVNPGIIMVGQMGTAAILSWILVIINNEIKMDITFDNIKPILYLGVISTMVAYGIQTWAQKRVSSTEAAVILSTEAFFGMLASVIILNEKLSIGTIIAAILIFAGVIIVQYKPNDKLVRT